jgi:Holliday junction resolvasome RuvABC endonuclease subunit
MILGLDMATKTGWCLLRILDGEVVASGVQDFSKGRGESNGLMFLRFSKWIREFTEFGPIKIVAYEKAHMRGGDATEICLGFQTRAQEYAASIDVEAAPVATTTLKKFSTGNGKAGKEVMVGYARELLGREPIDDNEADAVMVARWAWKTYC